MPLRRGDEATKTRHEKGGARLVGSPSCRVEEVGKSVDVGEEVRRGEERMVRVGSRAKMQWEID